MASIVISNTFIVLVGFRFLIKLRMFTKNMCLVLLELF